MNHKLNLSSCFKSSMEDHLYELDQIQKNFKQYSASKLWQPEELKSKQSFITKRAIGPKIERDFRSTYLFYKNQNKLFDSSLRQAYNDYINTYHQAASLYFIRYTNKNEYLLHVFDTEIDRWEVKKLDIPEHLETYPTIAQLPDGELFCISNYTPTGITFIIDKDYQFRKLPSRGSYCSSSAIYINRNVYCFKNNCTGFEALPNKFDLDKNCWISVTPIPEDDYWNDCVIFNENILVSGWENKNIFLYSIEIDSFSIIPYDFERCKRKIMINVEERLYLIEGWKGFIYESGLRNEYAWKRVKSSIITDNPDKVYCSYNKGAIYIGRLQNNEEPSYYTFSLGLKLMTKR